MVDSKWSFISDERLMELFCDGDNAAFEEIYRRYYAKLFYYVLQSTSFSNIETKDIIHDVFVKVIEKKEKFDISKKLSAWLYSFTHNACTNIYKHKLVIEKSEVEIINKSSDNDSRIQDIKQSKIIRSIVKDLKPIHKQVFLLRFNFGFTIKETSSILDISEGTVKSRLFNCIQILKKQKIVKVKQS